MDKSDPSGKDRMEAELNHKIRNLEQKILFKDAFITDAKSKIREMNMEYFGVSSDQLSDLKTEIEKMTKQVEDVATMIERYIKGEIDKDEARAIMKEIHDR